MTTRERDAALSRRGFCRSVVFAALAAAAGAATGGCAAAPVYRGSLERGRVFVPRERLLAAHAEAAADNGRGTLIVQAQGGDESILLMWEGGADVDSAVYRAVSARCTHQGCEVKPASEFLTCPCHGSTFDREGRVIRGPAQAPLAQYPVEATQNGLEIIVAGQ